MFDPGLVQECEKIKKAQCLVAVKKCFQVPVMKGGKVNSNVDMTMGPVDVDFDGMSPTR
jgi:hypothetical protein